MSLEQTINIVKPDVLLALGDAWMLNYIKDIPNRKTFKYIQYMPIDGGPIPEYWLEWLYHIDQLVLYANYGVEELSKVTDKIKPDMIYHGNHPDRYFPISKENKKDIFSKIGYWKVTGPFEVGQKNGLEEDDFVVGIIARNQPRKNYDRVLKSFAEFAKDKPNVKLWIHAALKDAAYNLANLVYMLKLQDKVCFSPNYSIGKGMSEKQLNMLMNMFDVHFLPCQGEGFGLPILENMACGVPQIVPDYSSHVEWCKPASILIPLDKLDDFSIGMPHPVDRALPKISECVKCLNEIYNNKELREELSKNARSIAEKMTWVSTIPNWEKTIYNTLTKQKIQETKIIENMITI